jgi:DNA-binding NtrC family response regulator
MNGRKILIADKDPAAREKLAAFFRGSNYQIETTGSAAYVLSRILQKQSPILLLGSRFDETITTAELITLLKRSNPQLRIILVSDTNSPEALRKVREEGIFYHALRPVDQQDSEELRSAVDYASNFLDDADPAFS